MGKLVRFVLVFCLLACSKQKSVVQGGQDSGGGSTTVSDIEDVRFYLNRSLQRMEFIFRVFLDSELIINFDDYDKRLLLYDVVEKVSKLDAESNDLRRGISILVHASEIKIRDNASCESVNRGHSAASINKLNLGSDICVSLSELAKLPADSLEKEIISLLLHEYMHAIGFSEQAAITIQLALATNYSKIFPHGSKPFFQRDTRVRFKPSDNIFRLNLIEFRGAVNVTREYIDSKNIDSLAYKKICLNINSIHHLSSALQKEELAILNHIGAQLVDDTLAISDIEAIQNRTDLLRDNIVKETYFMLRFCEQSEKIDNIENFFKSLRIIIKNSEDMIQSCSATDKIIKKYK